MNKVYLPPLMKRKAQRAGLPAALRYSSSPENSSGIEHKLYSNTRPPLLGNGDFQTPLRPAEDYIAPSRTNEDSFRKPTYIFLGEIRLIAWLAVAELREDPEVTGTQVLRMNQQAEGAVHQRSS